MRRYLNDVLAYLVVAIGLVLTIVWEVITVAIILPVIILRVFIHIDMLNKVIEILEKVEYYPPILLEKIFGGAKSTCEAVYEVMDIVDLPGIYGCDDACDI